MKALVHMDNAFEVKVTLPQFFAGEAVIEEISSNCLGIYWIVISQQGRFWKIQSDSLIALLLDYRPVTPEDFVWACEHE